MTERFEEFTALIAQAHKCILKIKSFEMKSFGLKAGHTMSLFYIGKHREGLTAVELGELCREDKAGISKTIASLKNAALIEAAQDDPRRKYRTRYRLTQKGEGVYGKISKFITNTVEKCGEGLTVEERLSFYTSLQRIICNLQEYYAELES